MFHSISLNLRYRQIQIADVKDDVRMACCAHVWICHAIFTSSLTSASSIQICLIFNLERFTKCSFNFILIYKLMSFYYLLIVQFALGNNLVFFTSILAFLNINFDITWLILKRAISYTGGSKRKTFLLNKKSEIFSICNHKKKFLVNNDNNGKNGCIV